MQVTLKVRDVESWVIGSYELTERPLQLLPRFLLQPIPGVLVQGMVTPTVDWVLLH